MKRELEKLVKNVAYAGLTFTGTGLSAISERLELRGYEMGFEYEMLFLAMVATGSYLLGKENSGDLR